MENKQVHINSKLYADLFSLGGDNLVAVYCMLKFSKNGEIKIYKEKNRNIYHTLKTKTNLSVTTLRKHIKQLVKLEVCYFDSVGNFVLIGTNKIMKNRIGEKYITYQGYTTEIIEYFSSSNVTIQFEDGTIIKNRQYNDIKNGKIKNPFHPTINEVGFYGVGNYTANDKYYHIWKGMLNRCYDNKRQKSKISYKDVTVCEEWYNFQNFAQWYEQNYKESFELDKDILFKGNKIYSPQTCCFIPNEINVLFTKSNRTRGVLHIGVHHNNYKYVASLNIESKKTYIGSYETEIEAFQAYKIAKEIEIKRVADKWKEKITEQTYTAMYNYVVEITD